MAERRFPVLMYPHERRQFPDCPTSVPWGMLESHEQQAQRNHGQTLERLAERGGLGANEMARVLQGHRWEMRNDTRDDVDFIKAAVARYEAEKGNFDG